MIYKNNSCFFDKFKIYVFAYNLVINCKVFAPKHKKTAFTLHSQSNALKYQWLLWQFWFQDQKHQ